jgi:dihydrofolate reductase
MTSGQRYPVTAEADMAKLVYSAIASLDGCIEDKQGEFGWGAPDNEVFTFVNDLERPIGTYLYGRRMYETMVFWETADSSGDQPAATRHFGEIWRAAAKIVYSRTLPAPSSERTRIERDFDPVAIRRLKAYSDRDITVGGAGLAREAMVAGLVDEIRLFLVPIVVGGGKRALPDDVRVQLELLGERRFRSGVVCLHYRIPS